MSDIQAVLFDLRLYQTEVRQYKRDHSRLAAEVTNIDLDIDHLICETVSPVGSST